MSCKIRCRRFHQLGRLLWMLEGLDRRKGLVQGGEIVRWITCPGGGGYRSLKPSMEKRWCEREGEDKEEEQEA